MDAIKLLFYMFSIQKFFSKDPKFFNLFEYLAKEAKVGTELLADIVKDPSNKDKFDDLSSCRLRSRNVFQEIGEQVIITFVTTLEREDIEALSYALYKTLKPVEKFAERLVISKEIIGEVDFSRQITIIKQVADTVIQMVAQVKKTGNLELVREMNKRLHQSETEADILEIDLLQALYRDANSNPLRAVLVKDLYDLLEKTIDRFRDVGTVVMHIVLKNS